MGKRHVTLDRRRWSRARAAALARDGGRCQCGAPATEVHHVRPLALGGDPYSAANLAAVCAGCHVAAHRALHPREANARRRRLLAALEAAAARQNGGGGA